MILQTLRYQMIQNSLRRGRKTQKILRHQSSKISQKKISNKEEIVKIEKESLRVKDEIKEESLSNDKENSNSDNLKEETKEEKEEAKLNQLLISCNREKAGTEGVDKEAIQRKIMELTKGTSYYESKLQRSKELEEKVNKWKKKIDDTRTNKEYWEKLETKMLKEIKEIEKERDTSRTWIHVDMDMFFAAVAILDNFKLRDIPFAIGDMHM